MTITMASAAISSADPETTSLDTMPVTRMATKLVWKAGWAPNVTKVCGRVPSGSTSSVCLSLLVSVLTLSLHLRGCLRWGETLAFFYA